MNSDQYEVKEVGGFKSSYPDFFYYLIPLVKTLGFSL